MQTKKKTLALSMTSGLMMLALGAVPVQAEQVVNGAVLAHTQQLEQRVHQLLDKAVAHVQQRGIAGVNDFNRDPRFTDRELYVFSLSRTGVLLSSGGWSATLVGQNVLDVTDAEQRPFFQRMLEQAKLSDEGSVEYFWFNPADGSSEPKLTYYKVVDNVVIAAGYFPGFATEEQAKALLERAVSEYYQNPVRALRRFRNPNNGYRNQDQYVFVLDKQERLIVWTPADTQLNDTKLDLVVDIQGKAFLKQIVDSADPNLIQQVDYWWLSPMTKRVELRRAFYQQVGESVLAVGTFVLQK